MKLELSDIEFRRLLDMVYIGNWILNSTREDDRIEDYDRLEEKIFSYCPALGMSKLMQNSYGHTLPSKAFADGGIHEAIGDYEDAVFFDILAEELSRRDMLADGEDENDLVSLIRRMDEYMTDFEENGIDNLKLEP